ncbi:hypothetical protein, conserved [Babesia bigemina]|uniref:Guanylate cyclase domain-containing protein n=1 Tax=Babesia bigemina TaxID=5866 RepID=A0A061DAK5_BABBI|nr:hypothetical protein, conserved [Babesia bigemina]CDR97583.1 hypothetical protein, conserved [Babesia bigemina]|eukprot:XP_012769769.1 hypothetical protein, conserved [Babesia bigemina]
MFTASGLCCVGRGKSGDDQLADSDFLDIDDAMREADDVREEWQWLSIRCERRLNEQLHFYQQEITERCDELLANASTPTDPSVYGSYVPKLIRRFIHGRLGSTNPSPRHIANCYAVTVFCDVSGFTALAEAIEKSGDPEAAATLGRSLNCFFDPLICIINRWGGDIMKFAGDAVLVAWFINENYETSDCAVDLENNAEESEENYISPIYSSKPPSGDVWRQCALALRCCEELHATLHEYPTNIDGKTLAMHIGVGLGEVAILHVGGLLERWEFVIAGKPLEEIAVAEPLASRGQTVMSRSVYEVMQSHVKVQPIDGHPDYFLFTSFNTELEVEPDATVHESFEFPPDSVTEFRHYMPSYIFLRLISGYGVFNNEMRRLSTVFVCVSGLDVASPSGRETAQQLMTICQRATYALEGSINKFLVDDKGVVLLIFVGFPPVYHTDDPVRSVFVGLKIVNDCLKLGLTPGVGITTGSVWCGTLGNDIRREYTCLGDYVNLAARLMSKAVTSTDHKILVDEATANEAGSILEFNELESVKLKGKEVWVKVFSPTGKVRQLDLQSLEECTPLETWKRWEAYNTVKKRLSGSGLLEHGGVMLINGHSGCGTIDLQSAITRLVKRQGYSNCFSVSTMKDDSSAISIASDSHLAWRNLCSGLVSTWAASSSRKAMMGVYHSKYQHMQSENCVSKKAVSDVVKELLDPSLHWRLGSLKPLVLGLEVEPLRNVVGHRLTPRSQPNSRIPGLMQGLLSENVDTNVESKTGPRGNDVNRSAQNTSTCDTTLLDQRIVQESTAPFVTSMVDGFTMSEGLCVILNIRLGSSVYATMEDDSWETVCSLTRLATERREARMAGATNSKPFLFIVVSCPQHVFLRWHDEIVQHAEKCDARIKLSKLSRSQLTDFVAHTLQLEGAASVPDELVDHLYRNTSGMARFVYKTLQELVESKAVILEDVEFSTSASSEVEEESTPSNSRAMLRSQIMDFFHIPRRRGAGIGGLQQIRELGVSFEETPKHRKRLVGLNLPTDGLIDEILSFAMSLVDRLQPDELFVAKVACVVRSPFVRQDLLVNNPQNFSEEYFDSILRSLLANEILESVSNMPIAEAMAPNVELRLCSSAIAKVLSQRIMEDERAWFASQFVVA